MNFFQYYGLINIALNSGDFFEKVGPLPADSTYDVVAVKEGYIFEKASTDAQGNFNAKKLASIVVNVVDGASGAVLSGVVVSISGGVDYRSNTVTKAGGDATFLSLAPGIINDIKVSNIVRYKNESFKNPLNVL